MANTAHIDITLVEQAQAQKEVTVNEALKRIDALLNKGAQSYTQNTPPTSPQKGDLFIVGSSAAADWQGHDTEIAYYDQIWRFITPQSGSHLWVEEEDAFYVFDGTQWQEASIAGNQATLFGVNTSADTTNRLTVQSNAALFTHEHEDMRIIINKNSQSATASHLFQQGYSGRAEFGLIGSNDFALKTSNDGTQFTEIFKVDHQTHALICQTQLEAPQSIFQAATYISASGWQPSLANGCSPLAPFASANNQPDIYGLAFAANTTQAAQSHFYIEDGWNGGTFSAEILWSHSQATQGFDVVWGIKTVGTTDGNTLATNFGTTVQAQDTGGINNHLYISTLSPIAVAGAGAASNIIHIELSRFGNDATDNCDGTLHLHGVRLVYHVNGLARA